MQEQRKSDVSAKVESQGADDNGQRLLAEVRQLLVVWTVLRGVLI